MPLFIAKMIHVEPEIIDHVEFDCSDTEFAVILAILQHSHDSFDHVDFYLDHITREDIAHLIRTFTVAEEAPFIVHESDFWRLSAVVSRTDTLIINGVDMDIRNSVVSQMLDIDLSRQYTGLGSGDDTPYVSREKQE